MPDVIEFRDLCRNCFIDLDRRIVRPRDFRRGSTAKRIVVDRRRRHGRRRPGFPWPHNGRHHRFGGDRGHSRRGVLCERRPMFSAVIIQRLTRGHNFSPQLLRQRFHTAPLYPGEEPASTWAEIAKPLRRLPQLTTKTGNPLIARMNSSRGGTPLRSAWYPERSPRPLLKLSRAKTHVLMLPGLAAPGFPVTPRPRPPPLAAATATPAAGTFTVGMCK